MNKLSVEFINSQQYLVKFKVGKLSICTCEIDKESFQNTKTINLGYMRNIAFQRQEDGAMLFQIGYLNGDCQVLESFAISKDFELLRGNILFNYQNLLSY